MPETGLDGLHRAVERVARLPGFDALLRKRYERAFASNRDANLFRGVFESFAAAQASAPQSLPLGYDNPASAQMYIDRTRRTYPTDYPILFWMQKLLGSGVRRIFDLGGHVGVSYYAYRKYLSYPRDLQWRVHDVPAVMAHGRELARQKDADGMLGFCDRFEEASGMELLVAQGSIQYLPETLPERLAALPAAPPHVLLNLTPLHEKHTYFTLQSVGTAFCPYRISAIGEFLQAFDKLGYALVDLWENPDKKCPIPFHPDRSLDRYYGFYFRRGG